MKRKPLKYEEQRWLVQFHNHQDQFQVICDSIEGVGPSNRYYTIWGRYGCTMSCIYQYSETCV